MHNSNASTLNESFFDNDTLSSFSLETYTDSEDEMDSPDVLDAYLEEVDVPRAPATPVNRSFPSFTDRLSFSVPLTTTEQMKKESEEATRLALEELSNTFLLNPELVNRTRYFSQMINDEEHEHLMQQATGKSLSKVWLYTSAFVVFVSILLYYILFRSPLFKLNHPLSNALDTCNLNELKQIIERADDVQTLISNAYPLHWQLSDSILHAASCAPLLRLMTDYMNGTAEHICKFANTRSKSGNSPLLEQMEVVSRLVSSRSNIHIVKQRLEVINFILTECNKTTINGHFNAFDEYEAHTPLRRCLQNIHTFQIDDYRICSQLIESGADILAVYPHLKNGTLLHDPELSFEAFRFLIDHSKKLNKHRELVSSLDVQGRSVAFFSNNKEKIQYLLSSTNDIGTVLQSDKSRVSVVGYHLYTLGLSKEKELVQIIESISFLLNNYGEIFPSLTNEDLILLKPIFQFNHEDSFKVSYKELSSVLLDHHYLQHVRNMRRIIPLVFIPLHNQDMNTSIMLNSIFNSTICLVLDFHHSATELGKAKYPGQSMSESKVLSILESVEIEIACPKKCRIEANEQTVHKFNWSPIQDYRKLLFISTEVVQALNVEWFTRLNYGNIGY